MVRSEVRITTPEQVSLQFQLAGIGSRGIAQLVDLSALFVVYALMGTGVFLWQRYRVFGIATSYIIGFSILMAFLLFWGYFIAFESLSSGKTLGKWLLKIRTISDDGRPVSLFAVAVRNLLRIVDYFPSGYLVGVVIMMVDPTERRLGDIAAGTLVVVDHAPWSLLPTLRAETPQGIAADDRTRAKDPLLIITLAKANVRLRITGELPLDWQSLLGHLHGRLRGMSRKARSQTAERVWQELLKLPEVTMETVTPPVATAAAGNGPAAEVPGGGEIKTRDVLRFFQQLSRRYRRRTTRHRT